MSTPTIHQRWDAKNSRSIGVPISSACLIPNRPIEFQKHFISPSAPSTAGLHAQWQQTPTLQPSICDDCKRDLFADEAHSSRMSGVASLVAFSLSDACPDIGGAHGYVDLLKRVTIPADGDGNRARSFARALAAAGLHAQHDLSVRDRLLAYVLWDAAMAPTEHEGLGFAPGPREKGGTLRFLNMQDPLRCTVEVDYFDFLRVLLEKVGLCQERRQERKGKTIRSMVGRKMRSREKSGLRKNGGVREENDGSQEEENQVLDEDYHGRWHATPRSSTTTSSSFSCPTSPFSPPSTPHHQRAHWCIRAGYRKSRFYRIPPQYSIEAAVARKLAVSKGLTVPKNKDKSKGRGRGHKVRRCCTNVDPNPNCKDKGKGRADAPENSWVFVDHPAVRWSAAHQAPFFLEGAYRFAPAPTAESKDAEKKKRKEDRKRRETLVTRLGKRIMQGLLGEKGEKRRLLSKVREWSHWKVAIGRSFAGCWGA